MTIRELLLASTVLAAASLAGAIEDASAQSYGAPPAPAEQPKTAPQAPAKPQAAPARPPAAPPPPPQPQIRQVQPPAPPAPRSVQPAPPAPRGEYGQRVPPTSQPTPPPPPSGDYGQRPPREQHGRPPRPGPSAPPASGPAPAPSATQSPPASGVVTTPPSPRRGSLPPVQVQPAPVQVQPAPGTVTTSQPAARRDVPRRLDEVRGERREERRGNQTVIREGDRTIIREGNQVIIRRDEAERFRRVAPDARVERRGRDNITTITRPGGVQIVTVTDEYGRLIRRVRRDARGRDVVLIDNVYRGPRRARPGFVVVLPPPVIRIPRERYIVEAALVPPVVIYETLMAPPVEVIDRRYTLDEIRYSSTVRDRMPRIDLDTITFDTGSWEVTPDQADRLAPIADGIRRAIEQNPNEVFLIEGHTDATGSAEDNLSLSDRRAESVALVLTEQFGIPPENLTTQGYGEQYLKVPTDGPERANRRVTVRRITPLLNGQGGPR